MIKAIQAAVSIPVMAKVRIGHFVEAQVLEHLAVDFIDESEVLTPADELHHIDKHAFKTPFVCGAKDLGEALRRIAEGAAMIRTKGEPGTGDVIHAVKHMRKIVSRDEERSRSLQTRNSTPPPRISAPPTSSSSWSPAPASSPSPTSPPAASPPPPTPPS